MALVLIFIDSRYRNAVFLALLGTGVSVWGVAGLDSWAKSSKRTFWERVQYVWSEASDYKEITRSVVEEENYQRMIQDPGYLEKRKQFVRDWQQRLQKKKASLDARDPFGQGLFEAELSAYMQELAKVKEAIAQAAPR